MWMVVPAIILVVGIAVILYGGFADRARNAARARAVEQPPPTAIPGLAADAPAPSYLSKEAVLIPPADAPPTDLSDDQRAELVRVREQSPALPAGWLRKGFVTDAPSRCAVLDDPQVLITRTVSSVRELLGPLQRAATSGRPLVLVAGEIAPAVADMLEVNVRQRRFALVAVVTGDRLDAATRCGATDVDRIDLQAGYVPDTALGRCRQWISDADQSWILTDDDEQ